MNMRTTNEYFVLKINFLHEKLVAGNRHNVLSVNVSAVLRIQRRFTGKSFLIVTCDLVCSKRLIHQAYFTSSRVLWGALLGVHTINAAFIP